MTPSLEQIIGKTGIQRTMTAKKKYDEILYTTDHHYPYVSDEMKKVELQILKEEKPKYHILGGDWIDGSGMSGFDPNPEYIQKTQDEVTGFTEYLAEMYEASPETKRIMIYGNHDEGRMKASLRERPFGVGTLRVLDWKHIFKYEAEHLEVDIGDLEFHREYELGPANRGVLFVHGDKRLGGKQAALKGGVTGIRRNTSEFPYGGNAVVIGHGHRKQVGVHPWVDTEFHMSGWMGDNDHIGYEPHTRYQNGLVWIKYSPNSRPDPVFHLENKKLQPNGDIIVNGKVYNGRR